MKLLSFPFAIIALSTVALSVGCGKSDDTGGDDTSTQTTDTGTPIVDADNDGVAFDDDCDDNDETLGAISEDADCDGWLTADDCDDNDSTSTIVSEDGDCDGWLTADDCDDTDATLERDDLDGDGYSTCDGDCDDNDATFLLCPITHPGGGTMIFIPAGTFDMGCTPAQQTDGNCHPYESPVHSVTLTHDFYMGETEVTQAEYIAIMGTNPSYYSTCGTDCPVEYITWHEMAEYANALSVADGLTECFTCASGSCSTPDSPYACDGYRLPTEAEWEYAARAGTDYVYAGSNTVGDVAWDDSNSSATTHPVAQLDPNDWGLYDMSGNVWERVWDWYDFGYYSSSPSSDPEGSTSASDRVLRGGCWLFGASSARVAYRNMLPPSLRYSNQGFRLSRTANP